MAEAKKPTDDIFPPEIVDPEMLKLLQQPPAKGWQPKLGDMVTGTVVEIDTTDAGGYGEYPLLTIEKDNKEAVAIHCFHTVLKERVKKLIDNGKLVEGDYVGVVYQGKSVPEAGAHDGYEQYRFIVKRRSTAPAS